MTPCPCQSFQVNAVFFFPFFAFGNALGLPTGSEADEGPAASTWEGITCLGHWGWRPGQCS